VNNAGATFTGFVNICTATRVDRWHIFKPKIPIWVNFGGSSNGRCWNILWSSGLFYGYLVYFTAIWYILWPFGIFFPFLVCCTKKNLATLTAAVDSQHRCNIYRFNYKTKATNLESLR
jgi:hypothetical protein